MSKQKERLSQKVTTTAAQTGFRADRGFAALLPEVNRKVAKNAFHQGLVRLNGKPAKGHERLTAGDVFEFTLPKKQTATQGKRFELTTKHGRHIQKLYEDDTLLVINKPAEIPVHSGQEGFTKRETIEDVLERAYPALDEEGKHLGRPTTWFVHRLDQETTGCLLIAHSEAHRDELAKAFAERIVHKQYRALVVGEVPWEEKIVTHELVYKREKVRFQRPERAPKQMPDWARARTRIDPIINIKVGRVAKPGEDGAKHCETRFKVLERFKGFTWLNCEPFTGRMHQIRLHLRAEGFPLAYDPIYGRKRAWRMHELDAEAFQFHKLNKAGKMIHAGQRVILNRLPLHALQLSFPHPTLKKRIQVDAPIPKDLKEFIQILRKFRQQ